MNTSDNITKGENNVNDKQAVGNQQSTSRGSEQNSGSTSPIEREGGNDSVNESLSEKNTSDKAGISGSSKPRRIDETIINTSDNENDDDDDVELNKKELAELNKLFFLKYKEDKLIKKFAELMKNTKNNDLSKVGSLVEILQRMISSYNEQIDFSSESLQYVKNKDNFRNSFEYKKDDNEEIHKIKDSFLVTDVNNISSLSGEKALTLMLSLNKDIKRIRLLNSGFFIDIKSPTQNDLNSLYNNISEDMDEYGRIFGSFFYLYSDLEIKRHMIELINNITINSNLRAWNQDNNLMKNISIHDYLVILHGIETVMYQEGYDAESVCSNPDCKYVEKETIDLNLIKYHNFQAILNCDEIKCLDIISSLDIVKPKTIREYKNELISSLTDDDNDCVLVDDFLIKFKIPSIHEYMKFGDIFNKELTKSIYSNNKQKILQFLKYNFCRIFSPWVEEITKFTDSEMKHGIKTTDQKIIPSLLDRIQEKAGNGDKLSNAIKKYISKTNVTHICYPVNPCPKCGENPEGAKDGFIYFDPQRDFFTMCAMRLIQDI